MNGEPTIDEMLVTLKKQMADAFADWRLERDIFQARIAFLQAKLDENAELHTMLQCATCKRGVQNQHSVDGMCPTCAEAELTRLRGIEAAVLGGSLQEESAHEWRSYAAWFRAREMPECAAQCDAIADALEVKP